VPTEKRTRKREGRQVRLAQVRAAEMRARRRRQFFLVAGGLVALFAVFVVIAVTGKDDKNKTVSTTASSTTTTVKKGLVKPRVTVPDGPAPTSLKIDDLKEGTGPAVKAGDKVDVQYVGVNYRTKKEFDSSYDRGDEPVSFTVGEGEVIKGWDQGLVGMKKGGRRQLIVPGDLAYGKDGAGAEIGPNDTLVFVIDLEKIDNSGFKYGTAACPPHLRPKQAPAKFADSPKRCTAEGSSPKAYVTTSEGQFVVQLDGAKAPGTVNNFIFLTGWAWYDHNAITRVVPGFVIQGGGTTGRESTGYTIPDELPKSMKEYTKYTVAMANTGKPDTGAGQWFVCLDCSKLPGPDYTIFGKVVEGMDVVDKIAALGTPGSDGPPSKPVEIQGVDII